MMETNRASETEPKPNNLQQNNLQNNPKHSAGPWVAAGPFAVLDAERNTLVKCAGPDKAANQALIAAAPELLEACEDIWQAWSSGDEAGRDLIEPIDAARRAIAKAKGETL